jgi:hypothetical protein
VQEPITETLLLSTSQDAFVSWMREYGRAKKMRYLSMVSAGSTYNNEESFWNHQPDNMTLTIHFALRTERPALFDSGLLRVVMTAYTVWVEPNGVPTRVFNGSPAAIAYFQELCEALRRKYQLPKRGRRAELEESQRIVDEWQQLRRQYPHENDDLIAGRMKRSRSSLYYHQEKIKNLSK